MNQVEEILASAHQDADGKWIFRLENGAVWRQIDDYALYKDPRPGAKITIERALLGSYKLSVDGQPGLRVHRDE